MKEHKRRNIIVFILILILTAACGYVAVNGVGEKHQGAAKNITLGLDLAGGVSITYEAVDEDPSSADMSDTVYKLQQRVQAYSTEAQVYQQGSNRIAVEIPGFYDVDSAMETLGAPGSLIFMEEVEGYLSPVCTGDQVVDAQVYSGQDTYGNTKYSVRLTFNEEGTEAFAEATSRNVGKPIYIVYDGNIISSPNVKQAITGGEAYIEGDFSFQEADVLATSIRLGTLNLELKDISSNVVGAQLGDEAVSTSLKAGIIGVGLVILLLIILYRIMGVAAGIALIFYVLATLLLLNALDITLTLPGIAGVILAIGMAVDGNVIIFSRIKEEIGNGSNVRNAIDAGFKKALSAIIDGNITTLIAAAVLYVMGTGSIKGFAQTLALGIVLSMITALLFTRAILKAFYSMGFTDEKYYGKTKEKKIIRFVENKRKYFIVSLLLIGAGVVAMLVYNGKEGKPLNFGLDFTGGTSYNITFDEHISVTSEEGQKLRSYIEEAIGTSDVQLQNVTGKNEIVIKTQVLDTEKRQALMKAIRDNYSIQEELTSQDTISGVISNEMRRDAVVSVIIALVCMLVYIFIRFRDWKLSVCSIVPLIHDVLVVIGVYAITRISVGNTFIACMLTIVGYSINATIVIFDRIRENLKKNSSADLATVVNTSITQTLTRSIYTSVTTLITVLALFILGVTSIREFTFPLMCGIICGAYSSVCIAGTLWYIMKRGKR
ncbi:MAG: protein translocase subunit SecD [Lachnospiraceae bacterium]|nr:protein translocase subunit SecD [Lachnospiraceae bacterium]